MTNSDSMNTSGHALIVENADSDAYKAGYRFYGECECHDPDGYGVGRCDAIAATREEIEEWHEDHLFEVS